MGHFRRNWMRFNAFGTWLLIGLLALPLTMLAQAGEVMNGSRGSSGAHTATGTAAYEVDTVNQLAVGDQKYEIPSSIKFPIDPKKNFDLACQEFVSHDLQKSICYKGNPNRDQYSEMFQSASKALGIPEVILLCMTGVESSFLPSANSSEGAESKGLAQVTKATAPHLAELFNQNKHGFKYVAWENYKKGNFSTSSIPSADTIRSNEFKDAPVQIFAMAMYLRNSMIDDAKELDKNTINLSTLAGLKKMSHYLIASYNGGEAVGRKYLHHGMDDASIQNEITTRYFKRVDKCLDRMATGQ